MVVEPDPSGKNELAIVLVHGWRGDGYGMMQIGASLHSRTEGAVFTIDWQDKASASPFDGSGFANVFRGAGPDTNHAIALGHCLAERLDDYERVHMVAHSLGSWMIDTAADTLTPSGVETHLTFLDAYVPGNANPGSLGDRATYAEHFVSRMASGWTIHTNELLPEAHNFDVTEPSKVRSAEHGWPMEWYAQSGSPGLKQSWEFGSAPAGHGTYPEGTTPTCLGPVGCVAPETKSELPPSELPVVDASPCVAEDGQSLTMKTCSPAYATLRLPSPSNWTYLSFAASLTGPGAGFLELRLGNGDVTRIDFGPEGFEGVAHVMLPVGETSDRLRIFLDTTGEAQAEARIDLIEVPQFDPAPVAPLPPATGDSISATRDTKFEFLILTAILALVSGGMLAAYARH